MCFMFTLVSLLVAILSFFHVNIWILCQVLYFAFIQEKSPFSFKQSQTSGKFRGMGLGSSSTSASAAVIGSDGATESTSDPQIQERVRNLETNLECERKRSRLMELDLKVEMERLKLIELKLEAEKERRRIMEDALLSVFHKMLGRVPQQFSGLLSQTQLVRTWFSPFSHLSYSCLTYKPFSIPFQISSANKFIPGDIPI